METCETITYKNQEIEIYHDDLHYVDTDEFNNEYDESFVVYDHRDFYVKVNGFDPVEIYKESKEQKYKQYWVFNLYAYIHGMVSLSMGKSEYPFNCPWDVSHKGFVLVKRKPGRKFEDARKIAQDKVQIWNDYLSGNAYGYDTKYGSCCGFWGNTGKIEAIEEAKSQIDSAIERKVKKRSRYLKKVIKSNVPLIYRKPFII